MEDRLLQGRSTICAHIKKQCFDSRDVHCFQRSILCGKCQKNPTRNQGKDISKQLPIAVDHHNNLTGEVTVNSNDSPTAPTVT